jgi:hypothetical protein
VGFPLRGGDRAERTQNLGRLLARRPGALPLEPARLQQHMRRSSRRRVRARARVGRIGATRAGGRRRSALRATALTRARRCVASCSSSSASWAVHQGRRGSRRSEGQSRPPCSRPEHGAQRPPISVSSPVRLGGRVQSFHASRPCRFRRAGGGSRPVCWGARGATTHVGAGAPHRITALSPETFSAPTG